MRLDEFLDTSRYKSSQKENLLEAVMSDRGRVIFAASFRRLQRKAQVFPLDDDAAVRSRLTHSLEVGHTGLSLGMKLVQRLGKIDRDQAAAIPTLVETACLLHDIGNPPFGHFGENAIRDWYKARYASRNPSEMLNADFESFDGNAQGFRIVTRLGTLFPKKQDLPLRGLNLCRAQLLAFCKYTKLAENNMQEKPGYFNSEREIGEWVFAIGQASDPAPAKTKETKRLKDKTSARGIPHRSTGKIAVDVGQGSGAAVSQRVRALRTKAGRPRRSPLAALMEAADDIANAMSDIEDGIEKRLLTPATFFDRLSSDDAVSELVPLLLHPDAPSSRDKAAFLWFKIRLSTALQDDVISRISAAVSCDEPLLDDSRFKPVLKALGNISQEFLFRSEQAELVELGGYSAVTSILSHYSRLLDMDAQEFQTLCRHVIDLRSGAGFKKLGVLAKKAQFELRLLNRVSSKYLWTYLDECPTGEMLARTHLIVDYVCGMTDDYAAKIHAVLSGAQI